MVFQTAVKSRKKGQKRLSKVAAKKPKAKVRKSALKKRETEAEDLGTIGDASLDVEDQSVISEDFQGVLGDLPNPFDPGSAFR